MIVSRRRLLSTASVAFVLSGSGLLAACSGSTPSQPTSAPPAAKTQPATPAPAASVSSPSPAASPAVAPAASPAVAPAASPVAVAPSPSAAPRAASPASPAAAGKPMYQHDAQHTGRSPHSGPRKATVLRRFDTSQPQYLPADAAIPRDDFQSSSAIGADGTIYVANFPGVLFALRDSPSARDQLDLAWRFHPPNASSLHATPALSNDGSTVYLGFASGGFNAPGRATLYALKAPTSGADAQVVWMVDMGEARVMASPTVGPDGAIYVTTSAGQLFAVAMDGSVRWQTQTGPAIKSAVALGSDGTIYQPSSDGKMYAVSPQGQVKWTFDFGEHLGPTPLVTSQGTGPGGGGGGANGIGSGASPTVGPDGTIYIGANNSNMYAVAPDGSMRWLFEAERELAGIWTTPCLSADGGAIYFGANKGGVYALNTANGSKRWQFPVYGSIYASSALDAGGLLFTGTTIEHLHALDATQGEPIWDLDIRNQIWSAPSIRPDGTLVIADRGGIVSVIG